MTLRQKIGVINLFLSTIALTILGLNITNIITSYNGQSFLSSSRMALIMIFIAISWLSSFNMLGWFSLKLSTTSFLIVIVAVLLAVIQNLSLTTNNFPDVFGLQVALTLGLLLILLFLIAFLDAISFKLTSP